jgi:hypothetical protein
MVIDVLERGHRQVAKTSCPSFTSFSPISKQGYAVFTTAFVRNTCKPISTNSRFAPIATSTYSTLSALCLTKKSRTPTDSSLGH